MKLASARVRGSPSLAREMPVTLIVNWVVDCGEVVIVTRLPLSVGVPESDRPETL